MFNMANFGCLRGLLLCTLVFQAEAQFAQQGGKLASSGAVGEAGQGYGVALSPDGNTAIIGGPSDDNGVGAAWVFTRSGGVWSQQGTKLVASGALGNAEQGFSVALSSDGNTAILGGAYDNHNVGAAWVFTRSGGAWSQEGGKLVGSGAAGPGQQGWCVALSSDGNTVVVGAPFDNSVGAAWVFARSDGAWSQQGGKLVGSGASGFSGQGYYAALSSHGNTAILGGPSDDNGAGAAWEI